MKLWGGRFEKKPSKIMEKFNSSLSFDKRLYEEDIRGSIVHVKMLEYTNVLTRQDAQLIENTLVDLYEDIQSGTLQVEGDYEDIHSFVEIELTKRIGEVGKKLHTARSRNDQVALDMRLYAKKKAKELVIAIEELNDKLTKVATENPYLMPGYTHLQKAQVVTFNYHIGAYIEMFKRDIKRINHSIELLNESPLGAGALAGTTHQIDRSFTSMALGFSKPMDNFIDAISSRDYLLDLMSCFSILMMHMSRLSEELIIWSSAEFNFVTIDTAYATGSSIMPQKRNADGAELIRGKTGRVYGDLITLLVAMKGLPLAYNKDMQEDKEAFFDSLDTTFDCVVILTGMMATLKVNEDVLKQKIKEGFLNATALADYLVKKEVPFRDAHEVVGKIIQYSETKNVAIEEVKLDKLQEFSDLIDQDVYDYLDYDNILKLGNKKEMVLRD